MGSSAALRSDDLGKLLLRLAVGGLLLFHGVGKIAAGVGWMMPMLGSMGIPGFVAYGVYVGEVVAPILILLGAFTRPAALVVAFDLVMAIYLVRRADLFQLNDMGALKVELELFYVLGALALFFLGGGRFGITRGKGAWD
jgi:putative oxidoreductase